MSSILLAIYITLFHIADRTAMYSSEDTSHRRFNDEQQHTDTEAHVTSLVDTLNHNNNNNDNNNNNNNPCPESVVHTTVVEHHHLAINNNNNTVHATTCETHHQLLDLMATRETDARLPSALAAWLAEVGVVDKGVHFLTAVENCVSLCRLFSMFAPDLLSDKDYFVPQKVTAGANTSRQRRYNTRRLARCLAEWFNIGSRSGSPVNGVASTDKQKNTTTVNFSDESRMRIKSITDAARSEQDNHNPETLFTALAECLLCAAVNSPMKNEFVEAILNLSTTHQNALAISIRYTMAEEEQEEQKDGVHILAEVAANDENALPNTPKKTVNPQLAAKPSPQKSNISKDLLSAPRGIPPAEFKALAEERDALRRKLATMEQEKNAAVENAAALQRDLEEASDRIREMESTVAEKESELASKMTALNETKAALREVQVSSEEMDLLKAKAASAEQLEASLKRASKRLEEVVDMRKTVKDLESQNAAYRDNEERMTKQVRYLETQLDKSNKRAQELAEASESMSSAFEAQQNEMRDMEARNQELEEKICVANDQLASMLQAGNPSVTEPPPAQRDSSAAPSSADPEAISARLYEETGVNMGWEDIVECIRGVVDAWKEMDELKHAEGNERGSVEEIDAAEEAAQEDSRATFDDGQRSAAEEPGADAKVLPEFAVVDSDMARAHGDSRGDEFDFAVDHANVTEIPVMQRHTRAPPGLPRGNQPQAVEARQRDPTVENGQGRVRNASDSPTVSSDEDVGHTRAAAGGVPRHSEPAPTQVDATTSLGETPLRSERSNLAVVAVRGQPQTSPASSLCDQASFSSPGQAANNLAVSVRPSLSNTSLSEATKALVRQTRSELSTLQHTMEAMRSERESTSSLASLIQQLTEAREELRKAQRALAEKEAECDTLRNDLDSLIKEHDAILIDGKTKRERDLEVLREKERLIGLMEQTLKTRDCELNTLRQEVGVAGQTANQLRLAEARLAAAQHEHHVLSRAQEVEIARLTAKLEASELIAGKLGAAMDKTDGLTDEIHRTRENYYQDIAEAAKRDKELAEAARAEAQRITESSARVLADVKATAARMPAACCSDALRQRRRSTRMGAFWRRLLHLDTNSGPREHISGGGGAASPLRVERTVTREPELA